MIDWNIVLYIGLVLIVFGFGLFLFAEMKIRETEIKLFRQEQLIKSFERNKNAGTK
jgi:site-specific recombinase